MPAHGMIVLRSFGKAYGLPGLRLGFAIAPKNLAEKLRAALGPWPVSGAAIAIGSKALQDAAWLAAVRTRLEAKGLALDKMLAAAGFDLIGGSVLFRLARHKDAQVWFERLAENGILVRRFTARPEWLRFGIGGTEAEMARLAKFWDLRDKVRPADSVPAMGAESRKGVRNSVGDGETKAKGDVR